MKKRLAFCIPSIGREVLKKVIERAVKYVENPKLFVIADDSKEKDIKNRGYEKLLGSNDEIVYLETEGSYTGAGNARNIAVQYVLDNTNIKYIFNSDDNAFIKSKSTIENIVSVMEQDERIGYCGSIGNFTIWYRDFDEYSARFFTNLGVLYCIKREVFEKAGNFDPYLECREDTEMGIRTWKAGYWVIAVWAPVDHTGSDTFDNSSKRWMRMCKYVANKHEGDVIATKNGQIRRRKINYPELEIGFDEDRNFYAREKKEEK
jgi:hypothetical protein